MASLPSSILLRVSLINAVQGRLMAEELALVERATRARRREVVAGRVLARSAMTTLGHDASPITQRPSGAPVWPADLCGSIAHSATHVAVAIAPASCIRSVGVDIEDGRNLGSAAQEIGGADEIRSLIRHPLAGAEDSAVRLLFSAKEALFKCQSALTGNTGLGFSEVRLHLTAAGGLRASPQPILDISTAAFIARSEIIFQQIQGITLAVAWIAA